MKTLLFLLLLFPVVVFARSGCCSWHGGVDYCDTSVGRYVCNDGTYSPSCGCYREPATESKPSAIQNLVKPSTSSRVIGNVKEIEGIINFHRKDYYSAPNGYREQLITGLQTTYPNIPKDFLASYVYRLLPDIKLPNNNL